MNLEKEKQQASELHTEAKALWEQFRKLEDEVTALRQEWAEKFNRATALTNRINIAEELMADGKL